MGLYESPEYKTLSQNGKIEIRKYETFYLVVYENPEDVNADSGFGKLFAYISSENEKQEKIKMTVPVIDEMKKGYRTMSFVVPSGFSYENIPAPVNKNLKISKIEEGYFAVIRYSGIPTSKKYEENLEELKIYLKENNLEITSNYYNAFYDPPFQVPFLRRNEIMVRIRWKNG